MVSRHSPGARWDIRIGARVHTRAIIIQSVNRTMPHHTSALRTRHTEGARRTGMNVCVRSGKHAHVHMHNRYPSNILVAALQR